MNKNLSKTYKMVNDIRGDPQEYNGLKLYPLKVGDVDYKESLYSLFYYPKNYIPDKDILKTSYIKYLFYVVQNQIKIENPSINFVEKFIDFFYFITKTKKYDEDGKETLNIRFEVEEHPDNEGIFNKFSLIFIIGDIILQEYDIDNLREIIIEQNGGDVDWIEEYNPDLEDKLMFMQSGQPDSDLKDEIYSFISLTNLSELEVFDKTLWQFKARLEREMLAKDYNLFKPLEVSGQVSSKNKSEELFAHYLKHIPKRGRYDSILVDLNKFMKESGIDGAESPIKLER